MHPAALPVEILRRDCEIQRTRRGGPGGQHRNKVESAIVITHHPSGQFAEASERRSQSENLAVAWQRLRGVLACEVRELIDAEHEPSALWQGRVRSGKISVNPEHDDFPALLAEALDLLSVLNWELAAAAKLLGVSNSQLVKFLQLEPQAFRQLNAARKQQGLHPLT
ncbi:MAG TPA: peptide chain release factor-like protein [Pirellulaceae bacterium]|nr:peptide chain release factor-like protein [Pirellulaceae bacterium]